MTDRPADPPTAAAPTPADEPLTDHEAERAAAHVGAVAANIGRVLQGKAEVIELALVCLLAEGHLLLQDVPGTGKTSLARALAGSLRGSSNRIQFTPDLLPSDVTGVTTWDQASQRFTFHPGGIFANVVVADELNRASPKTQSALLEVMEERVVTVDAVGHPVPRPFLVVATQNPIDLEGTYRLPEAQLDRFLLTTAIGYPERDVEVAVATGESAHASLGDLEPVTGTEEVRALIALARRVYVAPGLVGYIVDLAARTRDHPEVRLGASTRAVVALVRAVRARALLAGRSFATPDDVKALVVPVFAHRMLLTPDAELQGGDAASVLGRLLDREPVPGAAGG